MMKTIQIFSRAASVLAGMFALANSPAATIQVTSADIQGTVNWTKNNEYVLNGYVFVENGETLNIEAGTVVRGKPGSGAEVSALVVARGGKIFADGPTEEPIIFTSENDDLSDPDDLDIYQRGLWGGVVVLGKSTINTAINAAGNAATPKYEVYEGLPDVENFRFGGSDDDDNSGVLRYVSIRHGGKVLESNKEINGLSLGAVGRGTTIEYVECYGIADDGFEFFGGTVNTKYLIAAFCDDDAFDIDMGYRGKSQFWLAIQEPGAVDKGGEWNGEPNGSAVGALPVGQWEVYNATFIGAGKDSGKTANNAFNIRDYASPRLYNSIITDFGGRGPAIDATAGTHLASGGIEVRDNLWWGFSGGDTPANIAVTENAQVLFTTAAWNNTIADPMLRGISRTANGALDPRPQTNSPALSSDRTAPNDGFYTPVDYKGAFDMQNWATWSYLVELGILTADPGEPSIVPPEIIVSHSGTQITLSFSSQEGVRYRLSSASDIAGPWSTSPAAQTGTGGVLTYTVETTAPQRFHQIRAQ